MTVAIVGAKGFLGRHLVRQLRDNEGREVVEFTSQFGRGIDKKTGCFPDSFAFPKRTSAVVYLAQSPFYRHRSWDNEDHLYNVNVVSAIRAAMLARDVGATRFIYASTGNVYTPGFEPHSESSPVGGIDLYSRSKLHGEQALDLLRADLDITIVRPFGIYGPHQPNRLVPNLIESVKADREISLSPHPDNSDDGGLRISLCYIDDATAIISRLVSTSGIPYLNLAGPEQINIRQIVNYAANELGKHPKVRLESTPRKLDLLADISLLRQYFDISFTPFQVGIQKTLEHEIRKTAA